MTTFIDLFSGIGGFRVALENLGCNCTGFSEVDKKAIETYKSNFSTNGELEFGDITKIQSLPECDIVTGGVPCQPWSTAGKRLGFDDQRGKLWNDVIRLLQGEKRPKAFILENVKGLTNANNKRCFEYILSSLETAGYRVKCRVLNAYDFGLPQNRERVIIVGIRDDLDGCNEFQFPKLLKVHPTLAEFLGGNWGTIETKGEFEFPNKFFIFSDLRGGPTTIHSWDLVETTEREKIILGNLIYLRRSRKNDQKDGHPVDFYGMVEVLPDLTIGELEELVKKKLIRNTGDNYFEFVNSRVSWGINGIYRVILPNSTIFPTITATESCDFLATKMIGGNTIEEYRKNFLNDIYFKRNYLKPNVNFCRKIQGFPDTFLPNPNEKFAKKQFGNAVPVPMIEAVAKNLLLIVK